MDIDIKTCGMNKIFKKAGYHFHSLNVLDHLSLI